MVVVVVMVLVVLFVAVADLAGQAWWVVARAVRVAVTGGSQGGNCDSNCGSGSNG
jgi:hypothetical protein